GPAVQAGLAPVRLLDEDRMIAPSEIRPGDRIAVSAERTVPVDLRLERGPVEVDLAVLTGESAPVTLSAGDAVAAGAAAVAGAIGGVALGVARGSTAERLAHLARTLREQPSVLMQLADRLARALTPIVWGLAFAALAYWTHVAGIERGVVNALSVVLVACP